MSNNFEIISSESLYKGFQGGIAFVLRDKNTGVLYFYFGTASGGGLTPLLDKDGKPVILDPTV